MQSQEKGISQKVQIEVTERKHFLHLTASNPSTPLPKESPEKTKEEQKSKPNLDTTLNKWINEKSRDEEESTKKQQATKMNCWLWI